MIEQLQNIANECGSVSSILIIGLIAEAFAIRILWNKGKERDIEIRDLYEDILDVVKSNTEVITKLVDRIDSDGK